MKTAQKQSSKKGNPATIVQQHYLNFDHQFKSNALKIEEWAKHLATIQKTLDDFDRLLANKSLIQPTEVNKNFLKTKSLLAKISKDIEHVQKQNCESQAAFEQHFETPFLGNQFPPQEASVLHTARETLAQIRTLCESSRRAFSSVTEPTQMAQRRLIALEDRLNTLFLPEKIKAVTEQSKALNTELAVICKTLETLQSDSPARSEEQLTQTFLPLRTAHAEETEWLTRIEKLSLRRP